MNVPFDLQPGEEVLLMRRRHWLHLYPRLALIALVAMSLPVILFLVGREVDAGGLLRTAMIVGGALWAVVWLVRLYFTWFRYQHDVWVLTDQRLVDSLKRHWFSHSLASTDLIDIEDVSVLREGPLRTIFDYGDVRCQTAAQEANFVLSAVPAPRTVLTRLDAARDQARQRLRVGM
ncbi:MAG: hypothetical protein GEU80_17410 [Dehalococcoidia bacterium]|nr:hypothetical protein [Dehalococcoidia bacterium]